MLRYIDCGCGWFWLIYNIFVTFLDWRRKRLQRNPVRSDDSVRKHLLRWQQKCNRYISILILGSRICCISFGDPNIRWDVSIFAILGRLPCPQCDTWRRHSLCAINPLQSCSSRRGKCYLFWFFGNVTPPPPRIMSYFQCNGNNCVIIWNNNFGNNCGAIN